MSLDTNSNSYITTAAVEIVIEETVDELLVHIHAYMSYLEEH